MKKTIQIIILLLFCYSPLICQSKQIDSLVALIKTADKTDQVDILNKLSVLTKNEQSIKYAQKALHLSDSLKYHSGKSVAFYNIGEYYSENGKLDSSIMYFNKSYNSAKEENNKFNLAKALYGRAYSYYSQKKFSESIKDDSLAYRLFSEMNNSYWAAKAIRFNGLIYKFIGNNEEALKCFEISLQLRKKTNIQSDISSSLQDIGTIYFRNGDFEKAIEYFLKANSINEKIGNNHGLAIGYGNLGNIYQGLVKVEDALKYYKKAYSFAELINDEKIESIRIKATALSNIGNIYIMLEKYKEASENLKKALFLKSSINDFSNTVTMLCNYALANLKLGNVDTAISIYKDAEQKGMRLRDEPGIVSVYVGLGETYFNKKDFTRAIEYGLKGFKLAQRLKLKAKIARASELLQNSYHKINDLDNAYRYQSINRTYTDSLFNEKKVEEIAKLESKFYYEKKINEEKEKREKEDLLKQKKQQRYIFYAIIVFSWLLLTIAGSLYINKKTKNKNKIISEQNKKLEMLLEELKAAQNQLIQKEKMASLGILTAGIAHEINNPINYIMSAAYSYDGFIKEIQETVNKISKMSQLINADDLKSSISKFRKEYDVDSVLANLKTVNDSIKEGITRINRLVGALRNFSRSDTEKKSKINLHEIIDSSLLLIKHRLDERFSIQKIYCSDISEINCFQSLLSQVFTNVINNAIDAMESGGLIKIITLCDTEKNKVKISILDAGCGIDESIKSKIFDPFFTTKDVGKGVGLGLSISYDIIQKHGGEIVFNNCNPGTEVVITLPIS